MSTHAKTLASPQPAEIDRRSWTAIEIVRPAIVLLRASPTLQVLLVKNAHEAVGDETRLLGVRLIDIPLGARLGWLKFRARFGPVRLPDEFLYRQVRLRPVRRSFVAETMFDGLSLPLARSDAPFPIEPVKREQLSRLASYACPGRVLIARVREIFDHIPAVRTPPPEPRILQIVGDILTTDLRVFVRRRWKPHVR